MPVIRISRWHRQHCPYCGAETDRKFDPRRGDFRVHAICEWEKRRQGGVYLLEDGRMQFHAHTLDSDTARRTVLLHMTMMQTAREREAAITARV